MNKRVLTYFVAPEEPVHLREDLSGESEIRQNHSIRTTMYVIIFVEYVVCFEVAMDVASGMQAPGWARVSKARL